MKKLLGLLAILAISGCSVTGSVKETASTQEPMAAYDTLYVKVDATKPEWKNTATRLTSILVPTISQRKLFTKVQNGERQPANAKNALYLNVKITEVADGNKAAKFIMGTGDANVAVKGTLAKAGKTLCSFDADGNSRNTSETSVGGVNITRISNMGEDMVDKSMIALSGHIADYITEKRRN